MARTPATGRDINSLTTGLDTITFAGHESEAMLLGVFQVSVLHNIVHLLFGVAGLALSRTPIAARGYLIGGGIIYLVLWIYGLVIDHDSTANFVPVNTADHCVNPRHRCQRHAIRRTPTATRAAGNFVPVGPASSPRRSATSSSRSRPPSGTRPRSMDGRSTRVLFRPDQAGHREGI